MDALERFCRNNLAKQYTKVDETERKDLIIKAQAGDTTARNRVLESSYRYILLSVIKYKDNHIPMCDLITAGVIGASKAIKRFDSTKSKFLTFAEYHIRRESQLEIGNHSRTIRIPMPTRAMAKRYHAATRSLGERAASCPKEIEKIAGITEAQRKNIESIPQTSSANLPVFNDGASVEIIDNLRGEDENILEKVENKNTVEKLLECLTDTERQVIIQRFFAMPKLEQRSERVLHSHTGGETLETIAKKLNITKQNVQQIEKRALEKMRMKAEILERRYALI